MTHCGKAADLDAYVRAIEPWRAADDRHGRSVRTESLRAVLAV
jgi:hypothetical protein